MDFGSDTMKFNKNSDSFSTNLGQFHENCKIIISVMIFCMLHSTILREENQLFIKTFDAWPCFFLSIQVRLNWNWKDIKSRQNKNIHWKDRKKTDHVAKDSMCRDMIRTFGTYHDDEWASRYAVRCTVDMIHIGIHHRSHKLKYWTFNTVTVLIGARWQNDAFDFCSRMKNTMMHWDNSSAASFMFSVGVHCLVLVLIINYPCWQCVHWVPWVNISGFLKRSATPVKFNYQHFIISSIFIEFRFCAVYTMDWTGLDWIGITKEKQTKHIPQMKHLIDLGSNIITNHDWIAKFGALLFIASTFGP